jgi:hypothetical protein
LKATAGHGAAGSESCPHSSLSSESVQALSERPPSRIGMVPAVAVTTAAVAITAGVTAAGARATTGASGGSALLEAIARGVIVGVPLAVAFYACRRPAHVSFGRLLLVFGGLWFLASFSTSSSSLLYSLGRTAGWLAEVGLVYTVLAFPGGRLRGRVDWGLMAIAIAIVITLYLPTALFVERYPAPSAWSSCYLGCPHNLFMISNRQPGVIDSIISPVRDVLTALVFLAVAARLASRIREANSLMRRMLAPVLMVAIARLVVNVLALGARRVRR